MKSYITPPSPCELFKYDVVVASYDTIVTDARKMNKYVADLNKIKQLKNKGKKFSKLPERPFVTLMSGIWDDPCSKRMGQHIIFDEAHLIRNIETQRFKTAWRLRQRFEVCTMLSASPMEITARACFAYVSMLQEHPIISPEVYDSGSFS